MIRREDFPNVSETIFPKDKVACLMAYLFVLEKASYIYIMRLALKGSRPSPLLDW
jgi:hypothetical protein